MIVDQLENIDGSKFVFEDINELNGINKVVACYHCLNAGVRARGDGSLMFGWQCPLALGRFPTLPASHPELLPFEVPVPAPVLYLLDERL